MRTIGGRVALVDRAGDKFDELCSDLGPRAFPVVVVEFFFSEHCDLLAAKRFPRIAACDARLQAHRPECRDNGGASGRQRRRARRDYRMGGPARATLNMADT